MGRPADVIDPFDGKNLRIDRKRKMVWSVGSNGKDDGGQVGRGGENTTPDLGYPYGDHSFVVMPSDPFRPMLHGTPPSP